MFRGNVSTYEAEQNLYEMTDKKHHKFVEFIPDNISVNYCDIATKGKDVSMHLLANHTAYRAIIQRIGEQFTAMFRRKAFLHSYIAEGMDEMEFTEAESNMHDLSCEYDGAIHPYGAIA